MANEIVRREFDDDLKGHALAIFYDIRIFKQTCKRITAHYSLDKPLNVGSLKGWISKYEDGNSPQLESIIKKYTEILEDDDDIQVGSMQLLELGFPELKKELLSKKTSGATKLAIMKWSADNVRNAERGADKVSKVIYELSEDQMEQLQNTEKQMYQHFFSRSAIIDGEAEDITPPVKELETTNES